ncbi:MAG: cell division protein ZapA [Sphingobacteriaceae bacterium]|nr:cell division protein ZapA [Sphingobacteriaceae bacterium]MBK7819340.1 cell division protein ZapA [Sphingobacteriaceae bacterium]
MSEVSINVEIAGATYPVKISSADEGKLREVVTIINTKISEFERNFAIKDKKDVLAMVALQLVSQYYKDAKNSEVELSNLRTMLTDVEQMLEEHRDKIKNIEE